MRFRRAKSLAQTPAPTWIRFRLVVLGLFLIAACGCGKSERQKLEEQAAEDAQWNTNVAAADAERQKEEQRLTDKEVSRMAALNAKSRQDTDLAQDASASHNSYSTQGLTPTTDPSPAADISRTLKNQIPLSCPAASRLRDPVSRNKTWTTR